VVILLFVAFVTLQGGLLLAAELADLLPRLAELAGLL
jgi:hypothetical protein